jgi:aminoglycoside/choline kinase family phosphotransferase
MAPAIPQSADEVTAGWLTEVLHAAAVLPAQRSVLACASTVIGQGVGFLSRVLRVAVRYDAAVDAPATVVVKLEPDSGEFRSFGDELHAFEREIRFYREVAAVVPLRLPRFFYGDVQANGGVLVMEDLSFATPGDQVAGMHAGQVTATVRLIARLQARYWNNEALAALDWMPVSNRIDVDYEAKWPSLLEHFGNLICARGRDIGERLVGAAAWLEAEIERRPRTIVHNDLRADNLLFGAPGTADEVLIVDWQLASRCMGAFDVARLMGGSELPYERRGHQLEILRAWHDVLCEAGVEDYRFEDAVRDLRLGALEALFFPVHFHTGVIGATGRSRAVAEAIVRRLFAAAADIDAAAVLP